MSHIVDHDSLQSALPIFRPRGPLVGRSHELAILVPLESSNHTSVSMKVSAEGRPCGEPVR